MPRPLVVGNAAKVKCRSCVTLNERHRLILRAVGFGGATEEELAGHARSREFSDLTHQGLIVYWHTHRGEPLSGVIGGRPGCWCLTPAGAAETEMPPLRLA